MRKFLLAVLLAFGLSATAADFGKRVTWDAHSLIIDGRRVCPVMGEIHYSRLPADEWAQEVRRMKEGGVTIIATYVFWNHIEEEEGVFRWDGQRSLRRFLEVCKQQDMPVVLRLGPFCHGEVRNGGIPDWMFQKGCKLREQNPTFMHYAELLYRQIFTQVRGLQWKDGGPVIAAQFDNEYRGRGEYLMALKKIALEVGFDLPFYTRTGWPELRTPVPFGEMLPLFGDYADGFWDKSVEETVGNYYKAFNFKGFRSSTAIGTDLLGKQEERINKGDDQYPYFTCELGGGMATAYHRRPYIYPEDTYSMALVKLGSGSNLLGYYMYHGGTNPEGRLHTLNEVQTSPGTANNDLPVCTYDFQAPLGEFGQTYPQYYMLRPLHLFMHDWGEVLAPMEASFPAPQDIKKGADTELRWAVRSQAPTAGQPASGFIFINNYERLQNLTAKRNVRLEACGVKFPTLTIPSGCMAVFPVNIDGIRYATAQLVAKRDGKIYLMQIDGIPTVIALQGGKVLKGLKPKGKDAPVYQNLYLLTRQEAERLFLEKPVKAPSQLTVTYTKVRESGPLRRIVKGKANVAEAPNEADWQQAAVYHINLPSASFRNSSLLSIHYQGDCARLYADGKLIADNFYYGRPFLYGLWRLPANTRQLELRVLPLQPEAPIYLPREADRTAGERVEKVVITSDSPLSDQQVVDLSGEWTFRSEREQGVVTLPGSMLTNDKGDPVTLKTQWTSSLYDSSYYFNPAMERYRVEGQLKFPFFLTPRKHYVGRAWYERTVMVPESWKGQRIVLFLERPHIETTVFVNGQEAGHQQSLSVPHQYDITSLLRFGQQNTLTIQVYNGIENVCVGQDSHSVTDQTQGNWNGIVGRIELRTSPLVHRLRVETDIHRKSARILLNDTVYHIQLPADAALWDDRHPNLHTVHVSYQGVDVPVTFGLRQMETRGRQFYINGREVRLRGTVENCCFPETGYPPTDVASWMRILRQCKDYGLNHIRFHSYCPPEAAFIAADSLGFFLQPEGPSWPNHGVRLRRGMPIDQYLVDECKAIVDRYGSHPSFVMLAGGNEPAGDWVAWGRDFVKTMQAYDPSRLYCTASVGGGWAWDDGSQYHVKAGARGLDWDRQPPRSDDDYYQQILFPRNYLDSVPNRQPIIAHEQGQWCAFPDFKEIPQYTGVYQARNLEIFRDLLADHGMASQAERFLMASGRLQVLCYKYEIERNLRTPEYAGFQLLGLNDYSGQGTALVGPLNVHWREKGYCTARDWREFCSDVVPLALFPRFVYTTADTLQVGTMVRGETHAPLTYTISHDSRTISQGTVADSLLSFPLSGVEAPVKLTLRLASGEHTNHWDFWVYPAQLEQPVATNRYYETDSLDEQAIETLQQGGTVLLTAAGKIRYGNDVVHHYLPVFWNTSWFKMRPPHTTGAYIQQHHPAFRDFPTDDWQNLNWWELTNGAQVMNLDEFPHDYQPVVQPIDTWHVSRKLGMLIEARVLNGRLLMTTMDITNRLDRRPVARQLRYSLLHYLQSPDFQPTNVVSLETIRHLFEQEAPRVDMFTRESPDELKPKIGG